MFLFRKKEKSRGIAPMKSGQFIWDYMFDYVMIGIVATIIYSIANKVLPSDSSVFGSILLVIITLVILYFINFWVISDVLKFYTLDDENYKKAKKNVIILYTILMLFDLAGGIYSLVTQLMFGITGIVSAACDMMFKLSYFVTMILFTFDNMDIIQNKKDIKEKSHVKKIGIISVVSAIVLSIFLILPIISLGIDIVSSGNNTAENDTEYWQSSLKGKDDGSDTDKGIEVTDNVLDTSKMQVSNCILKQEEYKSINAKCERGYAVSQSKNESALICNVHMDSPSAMVSSLSDGAFVVNGNMASKYNINGVKVWSVDLGNELTYSQIEEYGDFYTVLLSGTEKLEILQLNKHNGTIMQRKVLTTSYKVAKLMPYNDKVDSNIRIAVLDNDRVLTMTTYDVSNFEELDSKQMTVSDTSDILNLSCYDAYYTGILKMGDANIGFVYNTKDKTTKFYYFTYNADSKAITGYIEKNLPIDVEKSASLNGITTDGNNTYVVVVGETGNTEICVCKDNEIKKFGYMDENLNIVDGERYFVNSIKYESASNSLYVYSRKNISDIVKQNSIIDTINVTDSSMNLTTRFITKGGKDVASADSYNTTQIRMFDSRVCTTALMQDNLFICLYGFKNK